MKREQDYKEHLNAIMPHLKYCFTVETITNSLLDGEFNQCGFSVVVKNKMKSQNVSPTAILDFDRRTYLLGFTFNDSFNPTAIITKFPQEFTPENSHQFIDIVDYFMQHIDVRMSSRKDVDWVIANGVDPDDVMSIAGVNEFWNTCLNSKIEA